MIRNFLSDIIVSILATSAADRGLDHRSGQTRLYNRYLLLRTQHKTSWIGQHNLS